MFGNYVRYSKSLAVVLLAGIVPLGAYADAALQRVRSISSRPIVQSRQMMLPALITVKLHGADVAGELPVQIRC